MQRETKSELNDLIEKWTDDEYLRTVLRKVFIERKTVKQVIGYATPVDKPSREEVECKMFMQYYYLFGFSI